MRAPLLSLLFAAAVPHGDARAPAPPPAHPDALPTVRDAPRGRLRGAVALETTPIPAEPEAVDEGAVNYTVLYITVGCIGVVVIALAVFYMVCRARQRREAQQQQREAGGSCTLYRVRPGSAGGGPPGILRLSNASGDITQKSPRVTFTGAGSRARLDERQRTPRTPTTRSSLCSSDTSSTSEGRRRPPAVVVVSEERRRSSKVSLVSPTSGLARPIVMFAVKRTSGGVPAQEGAEKDAPASAQYFHPTAVNLSIDLPAALAHRKPVLGPDNVAALDDPAGVDAGVDVDVDGGGPDIPVGDPHARTAAHARSPSLSIESPSSPMETSPVAEHPPPPPPPPPRRNSIELTNVVDNAPMEAVDCDENSPVGAARKNNWV